ncbi:MAG TPA: DUF1223 domain-containing protein, partial [Chitinophagaceae bacterium]|nr:DUF1223 domain-containing protein [Chitinophagaceae bacterium]
ILPGDIKRDGDAVEVNCRMEGEWQKEDLLTAIVQKHAEMNVKGGENEGAKLSHTNVVRTFTVQEAKEKMNFKISIPHEIANDNWQLVMYTRQKIDLKITGMATYQPNSGH